jgi:hypothetical protein
MGFRRSAKKLVVKELSYPEVPPKQGVNTLFWWRKGNKEDGYYFKGDLFDSNKEPLDFGVMADTLECLISDLEEEHGLKRE